MVYLGHFFESPTFVPPPRKPPNLELPPLLNSSVSFWSRDMGFVLFCSKLSTLQTYDPFISNLELSFFNDYYKKICQTG